MIKLEPTPPEPTKTKITGMAHVGYVKDNRSTPPNQKVKAVTATIPSVSVGEGADNFSSDQRPPYIPATAAAEVCLRIFFQMLFLCRTLAAKRLI